MPQADRILLVVCIVEGNSLPLPRYLQDHSRSSRSKFSKSILMSIDPRCQIRWRNAHYRSRRILFYT